MSIVVFILASTPTVVSMLVLCQDEYVMKQKVAVLAASNSNAGPSYLLFSTKTGGCLGSSGKYKGS